MSSSCKFNAGKPGDESTSAQTADVTETVIPKARKTVYTVFFKRFLDIVISGIAIILLSPLMLVVTILELHYHGKPVLYAQKRPGLHGELFNILKFRSMTNETDENGALLPGNKRITKFGRIIRKYSIDELPELFCIFSGKMSIIGPRPLRPEYLQYYSKRHMMRHEMRPGMACYRLDSRETMTWRDQFENDIWYIENCSFLIDLKMLFAVAKEAIHPSKNRVEDVRAPFNGDNLDM